MLRYLLITPDLTSSTIQDTSRESWFSGGSASRTPPEDSVLPHRHGPQSQVRPADRLDHSGKSGGDTITACHTSNDSILPWSVIEHVKKFLFFIGHARSGHSIIGSILDSHPHMVISYESNILADLLYRPETTFNKSFIFNTIWKNLCHMMENDSKRLRDASKTYSLFFDGLYQGKYDTYIDVIGDKRGGQASRIFMRGPENFKSMLRNLQAAVSIPIKVIHAIRNPFDNIATAILYDAFDENRTLISEVKQRNRSLEIDPKIVDDNIEEYFRRYQASEDAINMFNLDSMNVHNKDLIMNPRRVIISLCEFLEVSCPDDYIEKCSNRMFHNLSRTRYRIQWEDYHITTIYKNIQKFDSLLRYNFNS